MYEKFFGLKEPPFNLTPDSRFLFLSHQHREAMAALLYGIRERKGFILLTGEIGSGKTTLCRALVHELEGSGTQLALILNSCLDETELLQTINQEFGIDASARSRKGLIDALNHYLVDQYRLGHNVALIVDEAQNLSDGVLEQIRLLGNLETEQHKLLQIVLTGQPELQTALQDPKLEQLGQRIAVRYHLRSLEPDEIEPYIQHRLRVAGLSVIVEFPPKALSVLYEFTGGVPRKINLLCDRALLAAYVASTRIIDDAIIRTAAMEVGADQWTGPAQATPKRRARRATTAPRSSWTMLLSALTVVVVLAMLPVLLSESGLWARWFPAIKAKWFHSQQSNLLPTPAPTPAPELSPTPAPTPPQKTPAVVSPPTKTAITSTTFHLARPNKADPWTYDGDQVVRVNGPEFCKVAAMLTLLAAWGIEVNLQDFRNLTVEDIQRLDLVQANHDLGLRSVDIKGDLSRILIYDLPIVVEISDPEKRLSSHVVLLRATTTTCRVADPMMGAQEVPRPLFQSFWRKAVGIYIDPDNLDTLARGQKTESVRVLQQALNDLGFYRGPLTGEFDRATVSAVEYLQRYFEIFPTGRLDPLTVMLVTGHRNPDRPRLTPRKEQGP
jgi:general secretion pathway protein A